MPQSSDYFSLTVTLQPNTATRVVDSENGDRCVILVPLAGSLRVGFTEAEVETGAVLPDPRFVLPTQTELWVYLVSGDPGDLGVFVTKAV